LTTESNSLAEELNAVNQIVRVLQVLPAPSRDKVLRIVQTFLGAPPEPVRTHAWRGDSAPQATTGGAINGTFSEDRTLSAKEFMLQKKPQQDIERIVCLAYYLTHYRDTATFKTIDLSSLNTEAAQMKFSNAAKAVDNATQAGLLIPAARGAKQLSAGGELYVQALPDREAARAAMAQFRQRRKKRSKGSGRGGQDDNDPMSPDSE
jgi:hypothetical protein